MKYPMLSTFIIVGISFTACIKEEPQLVGLPFTPQTKLDFLAGEGEKGWITDSLFYGDRKATDREQCELDDLSVYTRDGSAFYDVGKIKCFPGEDQRELASTFTFNLGT